MTRQTDDTAREANAQNKVAGDLQRSCGAQMTRGDAISGSAGLPAQTATKQYDEAMQEVSQTMAEMHANSITALSLAQEYKRQRDAYRNMTTWQRLLFLLGHDSALSADIYNHKGN